MAYNWKTIREISDPEGQLYRLLGEMHRRKATAMDLAAVRDFLIDNEAAVDIWRGLGEALHFTTDGADGGFRLWAMWSQSLDDITMGVDELRDSWNTFGKEAFAAAPPELDPEELPTNVLTGRDDSAAGLEVAAEDDHDDPNSEISDTAVISFPKPTLLSFVPTGSYTIRFMKEVYEDVDEFSIVRLLRRGLLLGAEVRFEGIWVPVNAHPAFEGLSKIMLDEVRRVLSTSTHTDRSDITLVRAKKDA